VAACRDRVSKAELEALWKPLERAIPGASLEAPTKVK